MMEFTGMRPLIDEFRIFSCIICAIVGIWRHGRFVVSVRRLVKAADNEKKSVQQNVKQEENQSVQVEKEIKLIEAVVERNEENDKTAVINVVEDNIQKGDDGTEKRTETQTAISDLSTPSTSIEVQ